MGFFSGFSGLISTGANRVFGRVQTGTQTKPQARNPGSGVGFFSDESSARISPQTLDTYRTMRNNPTIALARMIATAPIKAAPWTFTAQKGGTDEMVKFVQDALDPLAAQYIKDACRALDYGNQSFERVWEPVSGRWVYKQLKALRPELTEILVYQGGEYAGVRQGNIDLLDKKAFTFSYDAEYGNWYGRSRNENVRTTAYSLWCYNFSKLQRYIAR